MDSGTCGLGTMMWTLESVDLRTWTKIGTMLDFSDVWDREVVDSVAPQKSLSAVPDRS